MWEIILWPRFSVPEGWKNAGAIKAWYSVVTASHLKTGVQQPTEWSYIKVYLVHVRSRVSSGSIVSDYGLDDRAIEVRSSSGAKDFSSNLCVQTGSEAHPASCTMGTGGPFPGVKRGRGVTQTTYPHLVPRSSISSSCISSPLCRLHGGSGTALLLPHTRSVFSIILA
jgi:hypothetical protein